MSETRHHKNGMKKCALLRVYWYVSLLVFAVPSMAFAQSTKKTTVSLSDLAQRLALSENVAVAAFLPPAAPSSAGTLPDWNTPVLLSATSEDARQSIQQRLQTDSARRVKSGQVSALCFPNRIPFAAPIVRGLPALNASLSRLEQFNTLLSSFSAEQQKELREKALQLASAHLSPEQRQIVQTLAPGLDNTPAMSGFFTNPESKLQFDPEVYLQVNTPDEPVMLVKVNSTSILPVSKLRSDDSSGLLKQDSLKLFKDCTPGNLNSVRLPVRRIPAYTLSELVKMGSVASHEEWYVDTRMANQKILLVIPHGTITANTLATLLATTTNLVWREVGSVRFLAYYDTEKLSRDNLERAIVLEQQQQKLLKLIPGEAISSTLASALIHPQQWEQLSREQQHDLQDVANHADLHDRTSLQSLLSNPLRMEGAVIRILVSFTLVGHQPTGEGGQQVDNTGMTIHNLIP